MKSATCYLKFSALVLLIGLAGCSTTSRQAEEQALMAQQQAQAEADKQAAVEAELARREQELAEQRARQAQEAEARRVAEVREREAAEARAREEAERAVAASRQAERQREQQARAVAERAQVVARQQARIAELREQIAANNTEATGLNGANAALKEAISAAEELTVVLTEEQSKYTSKDPATGLPQQALSKEGIEQLGAEIERLRNQADALTGTP